jgi:hypothetical protein
VLVDTGVLVRTRQPHDELCLVANRAIDRFRLQGLSLYPAPQNLVELWVVPTRPVAQNGLNLSIPDAPLELMRLKSMFPRLPDTPTIYQVWESLVIRYQVSGKPAHDSRLVAALQVRGLTAILTFDTTGLSRYAGIEVVHPADAAA